MWRELWTVSRSFLDKQAQTGEVISAEEVRTKKTVVISLMRSSVQKDIFPDLWNAVERVLNYSNSIVMVKNILARMIRCWKGTKDVKTVSLDPTAEELVQAERMLQVSAMPQTAAAFLAGKLVSLMPVKEGQIIVTRGRLGEVAAKSNAAGSPPY